MLRSLQLCRQVHIYHDSQRFFYRQSVAPDHAAQRLQNTVSEAGFGAFSTRIHSDVPSDLLLHQDH